jgi:hypothetical protein
VTCIRPSHNDSFWADYGDQWVRISW